MFGLVVIEVMTPSGHLSNINEIINNINNYVDFLCSISTNVKDIRKCQGIHGYVKTFKPQLTKNPSIAQLVERETVVEKCGHL
jgi:hypothetical protein